MALAIADRFRQAAFGVIAALAAFLFAAPAHADAAAEEFMRGIIDEANPLFMHEDETARREGMEALVDKYVDMRRVSMFVLGQYARVMTDEQRAEYFPLFRRYATLIYQDVLSGYSGHRLEVTNSVDRSERDIIVNSRVADQRPGDEYHGVTVHWRIYRAPDGQMSLFDAGAQGVWLAIEQQSQFRSVIANNGGGERGIDALIADLRRQVQ